MEPIVDINNSVLAIDFSDSDHDDPKEEEEFDVRSNEGRNFELEKQYLEAVDNINQLRQRLIRRTELINEIRKCYLRDVVAVKNILTDVVTNAEREAIIKELAERLPSLDLREALAVHAPTNTKLRILPCEMCGGRVEVVLVDSDEVVDLQKSISLMRERENRFKLTLAELDARLEKTARDKAESAKQHQEEKKFIYATMRKMEEEKQHLIDELSDVNKLNKKLRKENEVLLIQGSDVLGLTERLRSSQEEIQKAQKSILEDSATLQQYKINEKKHKKEILSLRTELELLKKNLASDGRTSSVSSDTVVVISSLETEIENLKSDIDTLQRTNVELSERNDTLVEQTKSLSRINRSQEEENARNIENLLSEIDNLKKEVDHFNSTADQKERSLQANRQFFAANADLIEKWEAFQLQVAEEAHIIADNSTDETFNEAVSTAVSTHTDSKEKGDSTVTVSSNYTFKNRLPIGRRRRSIPRLFKFGVSSYKESILSYDTLSSLGGKIYWHKGNEHHRSSARQSHRGHSTNRRTEQHKTVLDKNNRNSSSREGPSKNSTSSDRTKANEFSTPNEAPANENSANIPSQTTPKILIPTKNSKKFVPPKEKELELLPPAGDGNPMELLLRDSLIKALSSFPGMSQTALYRAMNASAPVIASFSKLLCQTMESAWESIANGRSLLEVMLQINTILGDMLTCSDSDTNMAKLIRICEKTAPTLEYLPSPDWKPPSDEGNIFTDEIMNKVASIKAEDTGDWVHDTFDSYFFHRDEEKVQNCVEDAYRLVKQMGGFSRETFRDMRDNLSTVFKDWKDSKSIWIDLESIVNKANNKVRIEMEGRLTTVGLELLRVTTLQENTFAELAECKSHIKDLLEVQEALHKCEDMLSKTEQQRDVYQEEVRELSLTTTELRNKIRKLESELQESKSQINTMEFSLSEVASTRKQSQEHALLLSKTLTEQTAISRSWQTAYEELVAKETERRNAMRNVAIQWGPSTMSTSIQTEFLTQPMILRTVVADNLDKMGVTRYPLPMIVSQPQSTTTVSVAGSSRSISSAAPSATTFRSRMMDSQEDNFTSSSNGQLSGRSLNTSVSSLSGVSFFNNQDMFSLPPPSMHGSDFGEEFAKEIVGFDRGGVGSRRSGTRNAVRGSLQSRGGLESGNTLSMMSRSDYSHSRGANSPSVLSTNRSVPSLPTARGETLVNAFVPSPARLRTADSSQSTRSPHTIDPYNMREVSKNSPQPIYLQAKKAPQNQGNSNQSKAINLSIAALRKAQDELVPLL